jgi:antitoxin ParD1/3/4
LTKHQEKLVETLVGSGRYQNASEVLREGLRLIERREVEDAIKLKALRGAARAGLDALERGEHREFRSMRELRDHLDGLSARILAKIPK